MNEKESIVHSRFVWENPAWWNFFGAKFVIAQKQFSQTGFFPSKPHTRKQDFMSLYIPISLRKLKFMFLPEPQTEITQQCCKGCSFVQSLQG